MQVFHCVIHLDISIMLHKVPILDLFYDNYHFFGHTWGWFAIYKLVQRSQKVFAYFLIFHLVFVILEHFAIYVNGFI
jgi:hypothetical protein